MSNLQYSINRRIHQIRGFTYKHKLYTIFMDQQSVIFDHLVPSQQAFLVAMKTMGERRHIPNISWDTASYLFTLLQGKPIQSVLEIGPANGFSTLILGIACPEAQIVSIECSRHAFEELRENVQTFRRMTNEQWRMNNDRARTPPYEWGRNALNAIPSEQMRGQGGDGFEWVRLDEQLFLPAELGPKVTSDINQEMIWNHQLYYADARELLSVFREGSSEVSCNNPNSELRNIPKYSFDLIFIDGAFRMTRDFFDLSLPLLRRGWTIIVDDAIKYAWKMDGFHEYLQSIHIPYELVQTDADDGIMVIEIRS